MLAQLLPGFRNFRVPIITGVIWLIGAWIMLGTPIPSTTETKGIVGLLNGLSGYFAPTLIGATLTFIAYIVGTLLLPRTEACHSFGSRLVNASYWLVAKFIEVWLIRRLVPACIRTRFKFYQKTDREGLTGRQRDRIEDIAMSAFYEAGKLGKDLVPLAKHYNWLSPEEVGRTTKDEDEMLKMIERDLYQDVSSISAPLQASNEKLFNGYDRVRSEAEFRFGLCAPLLFTTFSLVWVNRTGPWQMMVIVSLAGLIVSIALLIKGVSSITESNDIAIEAIKAGVVKPKTLERIHNLGFPKESAPSSILKRISLALLG